MQDAGDEFAECERHPCVHQISTLLLLRKESALAMQLSAADWLPALEERARAWGGGGSSLLKSTLFMGPSTKGLIQRGKSDLRITCFVLGKEKNTAQKVEFPLKDTEYFKSFTLHKLLSVYLTSRCCT